MCFLLISWSSNFSIPIPCRYELKDLSLYCMYPSTVLIKTLFQQTCIGKSLWEWLYWWMLRTTCLIMEKSDPSALKRVKFIIHSRCYYIIPSPSTVSIKIWFQQTCIGKSLWEWLYWWMLRTACLIMEKSDPSALKRVKSIKCSKGYYIVPSPSTVLIEI